MARTGEINARGGPKLALLPGGLVLIYEGLEQLWANVFGRGPKKKEKTLGGPM
jgi:hypothetical protein